MKGFSVYPVAPSEPAAGKVSLSADLERYDSGIAYALLSPEQARQLARELSVAAETADYNGRSRASGGAA